MSTKFAFCTLYGNLVVEECASAPAARLRVAEHLLRARRSGNRTRVMERGHKWEVEDTVVSTADVPVSGTLSLG